MKHDLERVFESSSHFPDDRHDVTLAVQSKYTCADWTVSKATLYNNDIEDSSALIIVLGLRGVILEPFERFADASHDTYMPCDIFGLVPLVGLMVSGRDNGLSGGAIERRNDGTYAILTFEAESKRNASWEKLLARSVHRFMTTWHDWATIIENTVNKDPEVGPWGVNWREFLAGESGFVIMPWYPSMSVEERGRGVEVIGVAARSLLVSVLTSEELEDPIVRGVVTWISSLCPVQELERYPAIAEEMV